MVFKRRSKRSYLQIVAEAIYPRGGWSRAAQYVSHRVRRLPDAPHRIARGIFAGIFVSFTPFFGLHFTTAIILAYLLRGNILAALLATFVGNPITFPLIAVMSVQIGHYVLGVGQGLPAMDIVVAFGQAGSEFWWNIRAMFTDATTHWDRLARFFWDVFLPYTLGGIGPGLMAGLVGYYLSLPLIAAYQKRRRKKLKERFDKLRTAKLARLAQAAAEAAAKATARSG